MNESVIILTMFCVCVRSDSLQNTSYEELHKAAQEAAEDAVKAVHEQHIVDMQAKLDLAEKALKAAETAQALYLKKMANVKDLEDQLNKATIVVQKEQEGLEDAESYLTVTSTMVEGTQKQLCMLEKALDVARSISRSTSRAVVCFKVSLSRIETLLECTISRIERIEAKLDHFEEMYDYF